MARPSKICTSCKKPRLLVSFNKHKKAPDGLNWRCRYCESAYRKKNQEIHYQKSDRYYRARKERDFTFLDKEWNNFVWSEMLDQCKRLEQITGVEFQRDHIIPLQGELVSGLHIWYNWRIVTKETNIKKKNRICEVGCRFPLFNATQYDRGPI